MGKPTEKTGNNLLGTIAGGLPIVGDILGSLIERGQARGDIERQNEYNHPKNQLARLREAGLPMAAMLGATANTQSGIPHQTGSGTKNIGAYITTQMQLKNLEILKAEIRNKNAEADLKVAEKDWLLSGKGEDRNPTNLTTNLKTSQGLQVASEKGAMLANKIQGYEAAYRPTRLNFERSRSIAEIANIVQHSRLVEKQIHAAELNNRIQKVIADYQPQMSKEQFQKLLKENNLLDETIEGKEKENAILDVKQRVEEATEGAQVKSRTMEAMLKDLTYDRVKEEFENYKQYMEFVQLVQDQIKKGPIGALKDPVGTFKSIAAMAYTTVTGLSGQMGGNSILSFIK